MGRINLVKVLELQAHHSFLCYNKSSTANKNDFQSFIHERE